MITVIQANMLNTLPLTYFPMMCLSLINRSMVIRITGSRTPLNVWLSIMASIKRFDGQKDDCRAQHDQCCVNPKEHRRFFPIVADAAFPAKRFAYGVGCGEGQDGGRKK